MPRRMKYVIQNKLVFSWTKTASSSLPKSRHGAAGSWVWCTMMWSPSTCHFFWGGCRFLTLTIGLYMTIQFKKRCFRRSGQSHPHCTWRRLPASSATNWHERQPTDTMVCYITYWRTLLPYPRAWSMRYWQVQVVGCFPPILYLVDINPVSWRFE